MAISCYLEALACYQEESKPAHQQAFYLNVHPVSAEVTACHIVSRQILVCTYLYNMTDIIQILSPHLYAVVYFFTSLKTKYKNIHRGVILQAAVNKSDLRITQIVKKAGYSRSSYYHHIGDESLSYDILEAYGKAMKYDFTEDLPEMNKYLVEDSSEEYRLLTLDEAIRQRDLWKDKYYTLLEKYHLLIEERLANPGKKN